jgi:hypothetical protein
MGALWSWARLFGDLTLLLMQVHAAGVVECNRQYAHEDGQDPHLDEQDLNLCHTLDLFEVGGEQ